MSPRGNSSETRVWTSWSWDMAGSGQRPQYKRPQPEKCKRIYFGKLATLDLEVSLKQDSRSQKINTIKQFSAFYGITFHFCSKS